MENTPYITLQQALKKHDFVQSGGHAKALIQSGQVLVDQIVETRRGRKLYGGETIAYGTKSAVVAHVGD